MYRGHYSLISPRRVYVRKLKGTFEFDLKNLCLFCWKSEFVFKKLNWKIEVCFKKWEFVFGNGSLNKGVCFRKWDFENGSMFWKMEVCFRKSVFESGSLFSKIGVENQNLLSKIREFDVGACSARVAWALIPDCAEGRCLDIDEMEVNAEATTTRKQPFWTWPKTRSKISKKRSAKEERKEGKQNAEPPVHL